jgi:hypothetical protein
MPSSESLPHASGSARAQRSKFFGSSDLVRNLVPRHDFESVLEEEVLGRSRQQEQVLDPLGARVRDNSAQQLTPEAAVAMRLDHGE